jgi:hypothetical protein
MKSLVPAIELAFSTGELGKFPGVNTALEGFVHVEEILE